MKKLKLSILFTIIFLLTANTLSASKIDSLELFISKQINEKAKMELLSELGDLYSENDRIDSALSKYQKAEHIASNSKFKTENGELLYKIGDIIYTLKNYEDARNTIFKALKIFEKEKNYKKIADCYILVGATYRETLKYEKAIEYINKALEIGTETSNDTTLAFAYNNLAITQKYMKDYEKAMQTYNKSLELYTKIGLETRIAAVTLNMSILYREIGQYDKAILQLTETLKKYKSFNDHEGEAYNLYELAKTNFNKAKDHKREIEKRQQYKIAISYAKKSIHISERIGIPAYVRDNYKLLYEIYAKLEGSEQTLNYFKKYSALQDSITKKQKDIELSINEMQNELDILRSNEEKNKEIIKKQNTIAVFIGIALLLVIVLAIVLYQLNKNSRKANVALTKKNLEINQQKEEIKAQAESLSEANSVLTKKNMEINQQKEEIKAQAEGLEEANKIVSAQKEKAAKKHNRFMESLRYAERIQAAILPQREKISQIFPNYFILFKPRDVVSGDFYWTKKIENKFTNKETTIVAVGDATGHGVAGGFLSTLGTSLLNEIVIKKEVSNAAEVLEQMRTEVKYLLKQGSESKLQDSMDLAFCAINKDTLEVDFAGANMPLVVIRKNDVPLICNKSQISHTFGVSGKTVGYEIQPNFQPVGIYQDEKKFANNKVQLQAGDKIYMFSDGYLDQLNERGRKFKSKRFRELLLAASEKSMQEQEKYFDDVHLRWRGKFRQMDDIVVMGIEL